MWKKRPRSTWSARRDSIRFRAMASCSSRARRTCTTRANGGTTAAFRIPGPAAVSSAAAASSPMPRSQFDRTHPPTPRNSSPAARSACRSISAPITSRSTCWKGSCRAPNGSRYRFDAMMKGEIEATTLTEPYATLAEKKGCRLICEAFYHGTEVASDKIDAATYGAFNRAVREAVRRINADKGAYLRYFIDYHKAKDPEIGMLRPQDIC